MDRIYAAKKGSELLLFALQFKVPYSRKDIICWAIDPIQHKALANDYFSRFIWYCFPFIKEVNSYKNILYHSLFVNPQICPEPFFGLYGMIIFYIFILVVEGVMDSLVLSEIFPVDVFLSG
ncbi:MAG: hypothetical protein HQL06_10210 [Nitrospirae bacterium]|nr:hypothetical protein [Nitrospirota bacterium]